MYSIVVVVVVVVVVAAKVAARTAAPSLDVPTSLFRFSAGISVTTADVGIRRNAITRRVTAGDRCICTLLLRCLFVAIVVAPRMGMGIKRGKFWKNCKSLATGKVFVKPASLQPRPFRADFLLMFYLYNIQFNRLD